MSRHALISTQLCCFDLLLAHYTFAVSVFSLHRSSSRALKVICLGNISDIDDEDLQSIESNMVNFC